MKILFVLIVLNITMEFTDFGSLIGKHISSADILLAEGFDNTLFGPDVYRSNSDITKYYHGISYNMLMIKTDENDIITYITIVFNGLIDRAFYDSFALEHGKPASIQNIDTKQIESESTNFKDGFEIQTKKSTIKTKECTFEDNPLFIFWRKETFEIRIMPRHDRGRSDITFSKTRSKL